MALKCCDVGAREPDRHLNRHRHGIIGEHEALQFLVAQIIIADGGMMSAAVRVAKFSLPCADTRIRKPTGDRASPCEWLCRRREPPPLLAEPRIGCEVAVFADPARERRGRAAWPCRDFSFAAAAASVWPRL
jgi:hypothetical protein